MKQSKPIRLTGNFVETPTEQTYHCENCNVEFPIEDERYGLCRECNEGNGFCYECEKKDDKIFELKSSNKEMLELLKEILMEVRPEISRVNSNAGCTIFNPVATETIDMAKEIINKAEGN